MSSRDTILAVVRANKPAPLPLPEVPFFDEGREDDLLGRFLSAFKTMGGTVLDVSEVDPLTTLCEWLETAGVVVSMVPEIDGNRTIHVDPSVVSHLQQEAGGFAAASVELELETTEPASLADVDVAIVRAVFGIAETGSIALTESELGVNTLGYLAQHLVVLLDPADILINLHHAYQRPEFRTARYTVFHTGPSATADIEGVLVHGAQGVRSLSILPLPR